MTTFNVGDKVKVSGYEFLVTKVEDDSIVIKNHRGTKFVAACDYHMVALIA